jgi:multidrug efflux system outer membrane protein
LTPELDLRRAEGEVAAAAAVLPDLDRRIAQAENRLSTLLGRNPGPAARRSTVTEQPLPPSVPAGLPSSLLERRPDIRQAEQALVAANARIGEAKATFFPQITLTGAFGMESADLADLFTESARVWQLGPHITLPIFNAGRNRARLSAAEARREQALIRYEQTIQQAFLEVEDALVAYRKVREVRAEQEALVTTLERAAGLAEIRYSNGLAGYLEVLDAQRQLFTAEFDLTRTQRTQLVSLVQVYKALGGGWEATDRRSAR